MLAKEKGRCRSAQVVHYTVGGSMGACEGCASPSPGWYAEDLALVVLGGQNAAPWWVLTWIRSPMK